MPTTRRPRTCSACCPRRPSRPPPHSTSRRRCGPRRANLPCLPRRPNPLRRSPRGRPCLILAAITVARFGARFSTLHHWKLESTSRGLLVIAALLVPLDFLVLAGLARGMEGGPVEIATSVAALAGFAFLVWRAGRVL